MRQETSVLVVDDNKAICEVLSLILREAGCAVTVAKDGLEAVEKVGERPFDRILMDIRMPGMNGVEAYKHIREIRPDALVMMMTAYTVEERVQEALRGGVAGVMHKPLDMEKVLTFACGCD